MVSTRGVKFKFTEGERVLCYEPDTTKARVLYDSKVLELNVSRDNRGRKVPEYLIHFYGWSSSWDRCVKEDLILPDTEENRNLQTKLASDAALSLKSRRKVKSPLPTKETVKKEPPDESKENTAPVKAEVQSPSSASESSDEEGDQNIEIQIPDPLKEIMEEDWFYITQKDKVIKLPCELNVIDILEGYVKHLANELITLAVQKKMRNGKEFSIQNAEDKIHFCEEVVDGIRVYFDFTLPHLLLYRQEKKQFYTVGNTCSPICKFKSVNTECQNGTGSTEASGAANTSQSCDSDSKTSRPSSRQCSSQKSSSEDSSPTQKTTQKMKKLRSIGSRPGLRSSDKSKSSEDELAGTANSSSISGPESDCSPTRPESPPIPTSPVRQTRHSSQGVAPVPPTSINKASSPSKRGASSPAPTNPPPSQQGLSVSIPSCTTTTTTTTTAAASACASPSSPAASKVEKLPIPLHNSQLQNKISAWRMLPQYLYEQVPAAPSLIYGGRHLLRLFVKLPELLYKTHMNKRKLHLLLNSLEDFLQYLAENKDDLFIPCFIDSCEEVSDGN